MSGTKPNRPRNPMRAIREKCLDCSGGSHPEVAACTVEGCPLFAYRSGRNPNRTPRVMTDEQRAVASARLAASRERKKSVEMFDDL